MAGTELLNNRLSGNSECHQKPTKYVWRPGGVFRRTVTERRRRL